MEKETNMDDLMEESFEDTSDALTLDDLSTGYIGNPAVGAGPISFVVAKTTKLTGDKLIGKDKKGKIFKKNLSSVDYGFEVVDNKGNKYTVAGWEVWGKLKSIFTKLKQIAGVEIEITHLVDGMKAENKDVDKYKIAAMVDGEFRTLDRDTKEWSN